MGNFTFEGQGGYTYLVYQLDEQDQMDRLGLGMLTTNRIPGLLPVVYTQMNGQGYVKYNISAKISAKNFFSGAVNRKRLLGVFSGIAEALLSAEDYMLDPNSILLDLNYIYADVATCDAQLVSVPIINREMVQADVVGFLKQIMFTAQFDQTENVDYVTRIINYLNSTPLFSLAEFKVLVDDLRKDETIHQAKPQIKVQEIKVPETEEKAVPENTPVHVKEEPKVQVVKVADVNCGYAIPGIEEEAATAQEQEKKVFSLFGGKKKSLFGTNTKTAAKEKPVKEKPVKEKKKQIEDPLMTEFSIPGMEGMNIPAATPEKAAVQNVVEKKQPEIVNVTPISVCQPAQPVAKMGFGADFGNTVNLSKKDSGKTTILSKEKKEEIIRPYLLRVSNNEQIYITKTLFHIGQEHSYADYCIMDNPAVSHAHADLVIDQNIVYLVDTNSTNGSFINGEEINPNVAVALKHGDKVTLANEEFVFYLY